MLMPVHAEHSREVRAHLLARRTARRTAAPLAPLAPLAPTPEEEEEEEEEEEHKEEQLHATEDATEDSKEDSKEGFVPSQAKPSAASSARAAARRDRSWGVEFCIELLLLLLGLNLGPLLHYYLVTRSPTLNSEFKTGVSLVDSFTPHLAAPMRYAQALTSTSYVPRVVSEFVDTYTALVALFGSLGAVVLLLRGKTGIVQSVVDLRSLQASSYVHLAVAWSWLSAVVALTLENLFGYVFFTTWTIVSYLTVILFSHAFAGFAQMALIALLLAMASGAAKYVETGTFGVQIAAGNAAAAAAASRPVSDALAASIAAGYIPDLPKYAPLSQVDNSLLARANRGAYYPQRVVGEVVVCLFAGVKLANARMQTTPGTVGAYVANLSLIAASAASLLYRFGGTPTPDIVRW